MNNPNGPYPGRQLFLGLTQESQPCFAYLVTGRSLASRERLAVAIENAVRIGPVGTAQYDPLRHYSAVKFDPLSGILAVSNGIQTEAVLETYKLLHYTGNHPDMSFLEKILDGAGAEPDPPLNTSRIAGIITKGGDGKSVFIIGIKAYERPAKGWQISPSPGTITGISTYKGDMEKPEDTDPNSTPAKLEFKGHSPQELADFLFDISAAHYKGADVRVCSLGGIRFDNRQWDLAIKNVFTI